MPKLLILVKTNLTQISAAISNSDLWVLYDGYWNDNGVWDDDGYWND